MGRAGAAGYSRLRAVPLRPRPVRHRRSRFQRAAPVRALPRAEGTATAGPSATTPKTSIPDRVPKLGVGLAYQPQLEPFINANRDAFAFVEVVPDVLWNDMG